jgi:hypothetical protein
MMFITISKMIIGSNAQYLMILYIFNLYGLVGAFEKLN